MWGLCESNSGNLGTPLAINSYFNSIKIRQHSENIGIPLNVTVSTQPGIYKHVKFLLAYQSTICILNFLIDIKYRSKLMQGSAESFVEGCKPNPCLNGGKCITTNGKSHCQCFGHFTG